MWLATAACETVAPTPSEAVRLPKAGGARGRGRAGGAKIAPLAPPLLEEDIPALGTDAFLPDEPRDALSGVDLSVASLPHVWRARSGGCMGAAPREPTAERCRAAAPGAEETGTEI